MAPGTVGTIKLSAARATPFTTRLAFNRAVDTLYLNARAAQTMLRAGKSLKHIQNETGFSKQQIKSLKPRGPVLGHYVTAVKLGELLRPVVRVDRLDPVNRQPLSTQDQVFARFGNLKSAQNFAHIVKIVSAPKAATA